MKLLRHWKMILGLLAIFVAGMGTGGLITVGGIVRFVRHRAKPEVWLNARMSEMDRRLNLTAGQKEKIKPLLEGAVDQFHVILRKGFADFLSVLEDTQGKVSTELTEPQRKEWEKMRGEALKRWKEFAREEVKKAS